MLRKHEYISECLILPLDVVYNKHQHIGPMDGRGKTGWRTEHEVPPPQPNEFLDPPLVLRGENSIRSGANGPRGAKYTEIVVELAQLILLSLEKVRYRIVFRSEEVVGVRHFRRIKKNFPEKSIDKFLFRSLQGKRPRTTLMATGYQRPSTLSII